MSWHTMKAFFLPSFLDMKVTTGMTRKVVINAPTDPCMAGQVPALAGSLLNMWCTMIRNVKAAMTLKELKIRNVAPAIWRNCLMRKASNADEKILPTLLRMAAALMGAKSVRSRVDWLLKYSTRCPQKIIHVGCLQR